MRHRSSLASVLALLVAAPLGMAVPASALARPTDTLIPTRVDIHSIGSAPITYGRQITIRGQVIYTDPADGKQYGAGGTVTLDRSSSSHPAWIPMGSDDMSAFYPVFSFYTTPAANARYRVTFTGSDRYAPSTGVLTVRVARDITGDVTEPRENVFYLSGRVRPAYAGQPIALMRKKCSSCAWRVYVTKATTDSSRYRFRLPLPSSGTHYFRARVLWNADFVTTFSPTYKIMRLF